MSNPVLVISYESGDFTSCPAEWASDKVDALIELGHQVILVTSIASGVKPRPNLRVIRVPSLSWFDYRDEIRRAKRVNQKPTLPIAIFSLFAITFGFAFDVLFRLLAGNLSWGRYSWTITAAPVLLLAHITAKPMVMFATGGPSSAQLSAVIVGHLMRNPPVVEFQDPIVGTQMAMSPLAWRVLLGLEGFLVRGAKKAVFVTSTATDEARTRHRSSSGSIFHFYPGAKYFEFARPLPKSQASDGPIEFVHLGSLYGSRNLDNLFKALDNLYESHPDWRGLVRIKNIGNLSVSNRQAYLERGDFEQVDPMNRPDAIRHASQSSVLLLVQHTDDRSEATIPYKTYDYLNLGLPVLGLLRNQELEELLTAHGGFCAPNDDVSAIEDSIRIVIKNSTSVESSKSTKSAGISIHKQVQAMLELTDA